MTISIFRPGPISRIVIGLVSMMVSIVLALAIIFRVVPDHTDDERKLRGVISESIAQQTVSVLQSNDPTRLDTMLHQALNRNRSSDLRSVGVRRNDGRIVAEAGPHQFIWNDSANRPSAQDTFVVPITADKDHWGNVELVFAPGYAPSSVFDWLKYPPVATVFLIALIGFLAFYLYMRRVLEYLDPLSVIPERVRIVYDTFREAVLVLDTHGRIVLVNEAFRNLAPEGMANFTGKAVMSLDWLVTRVPENGNRHPWLVAMETKQNVSEIPLEIPQAGVEESTKVNMQCTPIQDGNRTSRGCMVIFTDVTALHRVNNKLQKALGELTASKQEIQDKNLEPEKLASRDPLTGCLNRRALFAKIEPVFRRAQSNDEDLCCVMGDIDHFKNFNDTYGHSVGDLVLKAVARSLGSGLREADLLCRYGGEEFCIFLPGLTAEQAVVITERLRSQIENEAGRSIRNHERICITSSFGVSSIRQGPKKPEALIDLADQALYHSKKTGRNRVTIWN